MISWVILISLKMKITTKILGFSNFEWRHRDGNFGEIQRNLPLEMFCFGGKYKLERVKPQIFAVKICSKKLPIEVKCTILNI